MGKTFDLGNTLADVLKNVSDPDAREQIEYIPLQNIVSDVRNFYSMDGVDELAANIELIGLQQPLRVLAGENGFYVIVSGHRRAAAIRLLEEEEPEKWASVPCIVEKPGGSPEMEELRLIMANADTRRMSSVDLAKQAERVEMLLYKLKEQGMEFPGRMRDHVAEACKVSATRLAQLKVIREKLIDVYRLLWDAGKLNETCAYTLAKEPKDVQRRVFEEYGAGEEVQNWPQWQIENAIATVRDPQPEPEETPEPAFDPSAYQKQLDKENALLRKAVREGFGKELAREINHYTCYYRQQAIDRLKKGFRNRGHCGPNVIGYDGYPNGLKVDVPGEEKFLAHWTDLFDQLALYAIEELARQNEQKRELQFRSRSTPNHDCVCWCIFELGENTTGCQPALWKGGEWRFYGIDAGIDAECVGWIELPDYEGKLRK
ncbi:MAG: ParB N-terminal domain-containing protein [Firmicutes bacterium]|nr:ParB N-terminal domain-containing protein [Bacillota bacterium]